MEAALGDDGEPADPHSPARQRRKEEILNIPNSPELFGHACETETLFARNAARQKSPADTKALAHACEDPLAQIDLHMEKEDFPFSLALKRKPASEEDRKSPVTPISPYSPTHTPQPSAHRARASCAIWCKDKDRSVNLSSKRARRRLSSDSERTTHSTHSHSIAQSDHSAASAPAAATAAVIKTEKNIDLPSSGLLSWDVSTPPQGASDISKSSAAKDSALSTSEHTLPDFPGLLIDDYKDNVVSLRAICAVCEQMTVFVDRVSTEAPLR